MTTSPVRGAAVWTLLSLAVLLGGAHRATAETQYLEPLKEAGLDQKLGAQVSLELTFRDSTGAEVVLGDLVGDRPVVLHLVYYQCPMLCNMTMDGLLEALRVLPFDIGQEFDILTVSFDNREGPELAAAKKETVLDALNRPEAAPNWHFLTGDAESIRQLTDAVGFRYAYDALSRQYLHAAGVIVLTPQGIVSRYITGVEFSPRDLRLAIVEASEGRVSSLKDNVLLLCYEYDPSTGKYGFIIMPLIKFAGMTTVAALAGTIIFYVRRDRKRK